MKSVNRLLVLLLVAMLLLPATSIRAADPSPENCFGLADADCKLLMTAFGPNMGKLTSFIMGTQIDLTANDKGDPTASAEAKISSKGVVGSDSKATDPSKAALFSAEITAVTKTGGKANPDVKVEIRIVGGNIYLNTDGKWVALDLNEASASASSMMGGMTGGSGGAGNPMAALNDPSAGAILAKIPTIPGVLKATATDDKSADGEPTRTFEYSIDLLKLLKDKDVAALVQKSATAQGGTFDLAQLEGVQDLTLKIGLEVTTTDPALRGAYISLTAKATGDSAKKLFSAKGDIDVSFAVALALSQVGKPVTVAVPEGATKTSINDIFSGIMGGMGAPK